MLTVGTNLLRLLPHCRCSLRGMCEPLTGVIGQTVAPDCPGGIHQKLSPNLVPITHLNAALFHALDSAPELQFGSVLLRSFGEYSGSTWRI